MEKAYNNTISRRDFLKKAGLVGLAASGVSAGLTGCTYVDYKKYDYNKLAQKYDSEKRVINNIYDFALSGEEQSVMRPSRGMEKRRIPSLAENPLVGKGNSYPLNERIKDTPICEEWLLSENVGSNRFPWYTIRIFAKKFNSKEDFELAKEKIISISKEDLSYKLNFFHYGTSSEKDANFNIFIRSPFIVEFTTGKFHSLGRKIEHANRTNIYQKKRGLEWIRGNFDYLHFLDIKNIKSR